MAAETLIAAHETILKQWRKKKPEQLRKLAPPVRADPIYRPLAPSSTEEAFYQERRAHILTLPRYRLREVSKFFQDHIRPRCEVALIEDRCRMGVYRGRVSDIMRGDVDWPDDISNFAREQIPAHATCLRRRTDLDDSPSDEQSVTPFITRLLPRSILENVARVKQVDEYTLYRALDDLQWRVDKRLPGRLDEFDLERIATDHVILDVEDEAITNILAGYDAKTCEAASLAHVRSYPVDDRVTGTPLHVVCSPAKIYQISELVVEWESATGASAGE